jgi:hypothetical protein
MDWMSFSTAGLPFTAPLQASPGEEKQVHVRWLRCKGIPTLCAQQTA